MKFSVIRRIGTRAGVKTEPVGIPGMCDALTLCGPSREHVMRNVRTLALVGVELLELDESDRPVSERGAA